MNEKEFLFHATKPNGGRLFFNGIKYNFSWFVIGYW